MTENEQNLYTSKEPAYKTALPYAYQFRWPIAVVLVLCFGIYEYRKGQDTINQAAEMTRQNVMLEDRAQSVKVLEACSVAIRASKGGL